jgi:transposase InsO family protein
MVAIKEAFDGSRGRYGARKVWHQLRREGHDIARCTVERLMKVMGLQGVVRGKKVITINPDTAQPCPDDKVNRAFVADMPNQLWVSDFTYVSSWQGMVYVAFIIDVFARKIVGWRVSTSMTTVRDHARTSGALIAHRPRCTEPGHLPAGAVRV